MLLTDYQNGCLDNQAHIEFSLMIVLTLKQSIKTNLKVFGGPNLIL